MDCSGSYGNNGCNGGWMVSAFKYIRDKGVHTEAAYPYRAKKQSCQQKVSGSVYKITGYVEVTSGCTGLAASLLNRPHSVAVDATNWSSYSSGIFNNCGLSVNHGVLLVGISLSSEWKIKNSWGIGWGESGYMRLAAGNTCNICTYPSYPLPV
jgi:C1A family cysteine protease